MRHQKHRYKLGVDPAHRKAMMRNLALSLVEHGRICTTVTRAKALRSYIEKLVTIGKNDTVAHRRLVLRKLPSRTAVKKLFTEISPKYTTRPGGYTRLEKLADNRYGDNAALSYISFVE